jgi:hypothetical protein
MNRPTRYLAPTALAGTALLLNGCYVPPTSGSVYSPGAARDASRGVTRVTH